MMRTFSTWILLVSLVALGAGTWAGCDTSGPSVDDAGTLRVLLTDAPGDIVEANVTIRRVELVQEEGAPLVLSEENRTIDLTRLQDGVTETLADAAIPEGTYQQLRLILGERATIELRDGTTKTLLVPSGAQTGVKILTPSFTISSASDVVEITLDFSVEDSFVKAGASGMYIFKPTVAVQQLIVNDTATALFTAEGAVSAVDAEARTLSVDGITFHVPDTAEIQTAEGAALALDDLATGQFAKVDGVAQDDGTLRAREVAVQADGQEHEVEAALDAVDPAAGTFTLLGASFAVNDATVFEDVAQLSDLQAGDRVEVSYEVTGEARVARTVELDEAAPAV